jgi:catechol 2,3-dioxygenase-like lactoylglutathione lyase family enzyme
MALKLSMIGLVVQDMGKSLEFYRRLGLAFPKGGEDRHMSRSRWGPLLICYTL